MEAHESLDSLRDRFFRYVREGQAEAVRRLLAAEPALVGQREDGVLERIERRRGQGQTYELLWPLALQRSW